MGARPSSFLPCLEACKFRSGSHSHAVELIQCRTVHTRMTHLSFLVDLSWLRLGQPDLALFFPLGNSNIAFGER
ncbi:protein of unknown function [Aminobacter niigataensis]|nr:protein of unknown function [Aminobacter niigataensis]